MGYHDESVSESIKQLIEKCEQSLLKAVTVRYTYRFFDIQFQNDGISVCGSKLILMGEDIKKHLKGCHKAVLMAATLGIGADKLIKQLSVNNLTESFITDALASAAIEQVCDEIEKEISGKLENSYTTWRFSPGYGDFALTQQKDFLTVINAEKLIGLSLSEGGMLIPAKSVTAVIGVSKHPVTQKRRGCITCSMYETCSFRKRGGHCEF